LLLRLHLNKRQKALEDKLKEKAKLKREELEKAKKSPIKRVHNYKNVLKERFNLAKIKKVEMIDAWTQTSNHENENNLNSTPIAKDNTIDIVPTMISRDSSEANIEDIKTDEGSLSLYKQKEAENKFRVRVNSTINNTKTFRSPISNSITGDYRKREYNASFSLNKRKLLTKNNDLFHNNSMLRSNIEDALDMKSNNDFGYDPRQYSSEYKRNKSSRHGSLRNPQAYPQTQIRRSPEKLKNHSLSEVKDNALNRSKFATQYSTKGRRKSNQYLPDLKPGGMMSNTNSITSSGFSNNSMIDQGNLHLRSMSKDYNTSSIYKGARGFINSRSKQYVTKYENNLREENKDRV